MVITIAAKREQGKTKRMKRERRERKKVRERESERERAWKWWTDKNSYRAFPNRSTAYCEDLRSCRYRKLRVKGAVRVYWLRQSQGNGTRSREKIFLLDPLMLAQKRSPLKYLETAWTNSAEIRMAFNKKVYVFFYVYFWGLIIPLSK